MRGGYSIIDEPRPGPFARVVVNPLWPLVATMLAGPLYGWGWALFNGFALGSASRWRELTFVGLGVLATVGALLLLGTLKEAGTLTDGAMPYVRVALKALWLTVAYAIYQRQADSFEIHETYGGTSANGPLGLLLVGLVLPRLLSGIKGVL